MVPDIIPVVYQAFYIVIPTISMIGNAFIVYVTIRSNIEGHEIRQDFCVYLQLFPLFGTYFSSVMLFNMALDRLLSLQKIYSTIDILHKKLYMTAQILPALVFSLMMVAWIFVSRTPAHMVICVLTAPMIGIIATVSMSFSIFCNISTIVCYGSANMKQIYRSLIVISSTTVCGWLATMVCAFITGLLDAERQINVNLLAGLFVNIACATNFFVYYIISKEYRVKFDDELGIIHFKRLFGVNNVTTNTANPATNRLTAMPSQRNTAISKMKLTREEI